MGFLFLGKAFLCKRMKILVLRFSSIGDIVLTTPVMRCLHEQKNAEVHFLTKSSFRSVVEHNPHISRCWFFDKEVTEVLPELKKENFDLIIDLHRNLRSLRVKMALRKPSRSFSKLNFAKWKKVTFKSTVLPKVHIVDRYLETVAHLGVKNDLKGLDFFIPEDKEVQRNTLPTFLHQDYVAFAIGAQHATKRLPVEKIASICAGLPLPIVLLGGKEDAAAGEKIAAHAPERIFNACGKFDLYGSASLVKQARVVISHDTGLMHIAAAFHKKIVSVWGNTIPEFGMYPYLPQEKELYRIIENKETHCRPCSKIGHAECPKKHFQCMLGIPDKAITEASEELFL
jgi:ADP-heptose:LPS heptosyltransferase